MRADPGPHAQPGEDHHRAVDGAGQQEDHGGAVDDPRPGEAPGAHRPGADGQAARAAHRHDRPERLLGPGEPAHIARTRAPDHEPDDGHIAQAGGDLQPDGQHQPARVRMRDPVAYVAQVGHRKPDRKEHHAQRDCPNHAVAQAVRVALGAAVVLADCPSGGCCAGSTFSGPCSCPRSVAHRGLYRTIVRAANYCVCN